MDDMVFFYPQGHEAHYESGHPERPERVEAIRQALQEAGWWGNYPLLPPIELSREFLESVHSPSYLDNLEKVCLQGSRLDMDTYTTPASWKLALNAAGGAAAVAYAVWEGKSKRGIALTRPPGHHATTHRGMGFCLLNNVALAAEYLVSIPGGQVLKAQKLGIIDLDLHHGNGTQDIFWQRGDVFYISTHQSPFYPGTGLLEETGKGPGTGCTANFPLPAYTGNNGFKEVMEVLILPLLDRFSPEMLLVSIGFDPHWRDPLGNLLLSAEGFGYLIESLTSWADRNCAGKIALFLEGGYDLEAGKACGLAAASALLKQPWEDSLGPSPQSEGSSWKLVVQNARQIWNV
jgi:acetoin utilization deacetylase AcuC-like enzyme